MTTRTTTRRAIRDFLLTRCLMTRPAAHHPEAADTSFEHEVLKDLMRELGIDDEDAELPDVPLADLGAVDAAGAPDAAAGSWRCRWCTRCRW